MSFLFAVLDFGTQFGNAAIVSHRSDSQQGDCQIAGPGGGGSLLRPAVNALHVMHVYVNPKPVQMQSGAEPGQAGLEPFVAHHDPHIVKQPIQRKRATHQFHPDNLEPAFFEKPS